MFQGHVCTLCTAKVHVCQSAAAPQSPSNSLICKNVSSNSNNTLRDHQPVVFVIFKPLQFLIPVLVNNLSTSLIHILKLLKRCCVYDADWTIGYLKCYVASLKPLPAIFCLLSYVYVFPYRSKMDTFASPIGGSLFIGIAYDNLHLIFRSKTLGLWSFPL